MRPPFPRKKNCVYLASWAIENENIKQNNMKYFIPILVSVVCLLSACGTRQIQPKVEGHYTYEHAFNYDLEGNHFDVHETGTMDFFADSTALDSARQVYFITSEAGDTTTVVFNYVSPSRWHLDGEDFYFAGIKEDFRMDVVAGDTTSLLPQKIITVVGGSIDYEYKFHLDTLTADLLQWSFTYRDGHSDTWRFYKK